MKFLTKIGSIILKVTEVVAGFAPLATMVRPDQAEHIQMVSRDLTEIANVVVQVEAVGQALSLPGTQKLTAATPLVAQVLLGSSMLAGHKISDEALFKQGAQKIADGMADVLNSLHDNVDTTPKT